VTGPARRSSDAATSDPSTVRIGRGAPLLPAAFSGLRDWDHIPLLRETPLTRSVSRRAVLGMGVTATAALAGCSAQPRPANPPATTSTAATSGSATATTAGTPATTTPTGGPAVEVVRGSGDRKEVALTFHGAGSLDITRQVITLLGKHGAKVTVLAVGSWLATTPDAARMVRDAGHELGNHTWSHPDLARLAPAAVLAEIERCRDALARVTGTPGTFFRQSQNQHATREELAQAGKAGYTRALSYDVDSLDWTDPGVSGIRKATAAAKAGSVVSMHLGHEGTVAALPGILADFASKGLTLVTATELLR